MGLRMGGRQLTDEIVEKRGGVPSDTFDTQ